jgi:hypothetical protein
MSGQPLVYQVLHIIEASRSHSDTLPSVGLLCTSDHPSQIPVPDHKAHKRQTFMPPAEFEPAMAANERPQTHALDRAAIGIGRYRGHHLCHNRKMMLFSTPKCFINISLLARSVHTFRLNTTSSVFWPSVCAPYCCYNKQWLFLRTALSGLSSNDLTMFSVRYELHLLM